MIEAKWDHLNKRLYENMDKPEIELDIWKSYKGYHRSELNNPNIIEWIQSKRLRALYRAVEPTLQLIQDPSRDVANHRKDINYSPIPWYYKTLLYGIDPNRDRDRPDGQQQGKERSQKFHPTMRYVLRKDHQQMKEIWQEYEEFHSQMEQQPEDSQPWPYEEKYNKFHKPHQRQWLREQRAITVAQRRRVEIMNEWDRVIWYQQECGSKSWEFITKPGVFHTLVTPHKIRTENPQTEWYCPNNNTCTKKFANWLALQRHLFSQINPTSNIHNPQASQCYIQLPQDDAQARAIIEQFGPLQPATRNCPFGIKSRHGSINAKVQTCKFCQNQSQTISVGAKNYYPKLAAYTKNLKKRK